MRAIFFRTDCVEGNDRYTLLIDQVAKLKEENERLKIENQMLDSRHKVWKIKVCDMLDGFQDAVYNTEEGLNWRRILSIDRGLKKRTARLCTT